tara:strand:+ start:1396 stop:1683 length:288 start_codon:yes stop_codon:yes gene_type:complete
MQYFTILNTDKMKTREKKSSNETDLEPFYKVMEAEPRKFEEALEVLLEMVTSDSQSTKNVALLIKEDYPILYRAIMDLSENNKGENPLTPCCGGH